MLGLRRSTGIIITVLTAGLAVPIVAGFGQLDRRGFTGSLHPAIEYDTRPLSDPVSQLSRRLEDGSVRLTFDDGPGYLRSMLDALKVPVESQMLVFSKTGVQRAHTDPRNPRALFFNDTVVVGFVRGTSILELAAHDPRQGVIFYTLEQRQQSRASFARADGRCLGCHVSFNSLDVPGMPDYFQPVTQ